MGRKIRRNRIGNYFIVQNERGGNESEGGEKYSCFEYLSVQNNNAMEELSKLFVDNFHLSPTRINLKQEMKPRNTQSPTKEYNNSIDVSTTIRKILSTSLEVHEGEPPILI